MVERRLLPNGHIQRFRFQLLLPLLLAYFIVIPIFGSSIILDVSATAVLIFAVTVAGVSRWLLAACMILSGTAILGLWAIKLFPYTAVVVASAGLDLGFFLLVTILILSRVFQAHKITRETIAGAICAYLLIGILWADAYFIVQNLSPGSFSGTLSPDMDGEIVSMTRQDISHFSYFSLVTLSTLGYGDITPVTRVSRSLAATEAIVGQLYLAVLIARLVGQQASPQDKQDGDESLQDPS